MNLAPALTEQLKFEEIPEHITKAFFIESECLRTNNSHVRETPPSGAPI